MGIDLSLTTKSNVTLSKESKDVGLTWDDANWIWDDADSSWDAPKMKLSLGEIKSSLDLSLTSK